MFDIVPPNPSQTFQRYLALLQDMCGENTYAFVFLQQIIQVSLIWDHVADKDEFQPSNFDAVMTVMATEWPLNPFLRQNGVSIVPTMVASINAWRYGKSRDMHYSVYRELPCAVAFVLGGNALVAKYMPVLADLVSQMQIENDARAAKKEQEVAV